MPHSHYAAFGSFLVSAILLLAALIYVRGCVRLRSLDRETIQGWRTASFLIGLFLVWAAVASRFAALDHESLTVHMAQHLLLMTIAAPLVLLGAPVKPLLEGLPQWIVQVVVVPLLRWPFIPRWGRIIVHPAVCWLGAAVTLTVWHIPPVFMLGMRSGIWHGIQQASFLATGLLFWWPVIQPVATRSKWPEWSILLYLFFATLPCDVLSGFLVFCDRVVYPVYLLSSNRFGLSALQDQQCAGALMWTCVTVIYLIAGTIVTARLLSPHNSQECWTAKQHSRPSTSPQTTRRSLEVV